MLKLIRGKLNPEKEKEKRDSIYRHKISVYERAINRLKQNHSHYDSREFARKAAILEVKKFIQMYHMNRKNACTYEASEQVMSVLRLLSPKDLVNLFPVAKIFNTKDDSIDYEYTMGYLKKFDWDSLMGENTEDILGEYANNDIRKVIHAYFLGCIHKYEEHTGEESPLLEFLRQEEIEIFRQSGSALFGEKGTVLPVKERKRRIPAYMRLVSC